MNSISSKCTQVYNNIKLNIIQQNKISLIHQLKEENERLKQLLWIQKKDHDQKEEELHKIMNNLCVENLIQRGRIESIQKHYSILTQSQQNQGNEQIKFIEKIELSQSETNQQSQKLIEEIQAFKQQVQNLQSKIVEKDEELKYLKMYKTQLETQLKQKDSLIASQEKKFKDFESQSLQVMQQKMIQLSKELTEEKAKNQFIIGKNLQI